MTWSNFAFCFLHAARDAGASAITLSHTAGATDYKDFLIDDRAGSLFKFGASGSGRYIDLDRGAGTLDDIERIIIPVGHNMSGATFDVDADTTSGFTSSTNLVASSAITASMIDVTFSAANSEQYVRFSIYGSGQWEIPELIYTQKKTPSIGPEQGWEDYLIHNTLDFEKESGVIASLALGSDRRFFSLQYRGVDNATDLTIFEDLIATCGTSKPFYILPAYETTPLWVKMVGNSVQTQEELIPATTDNITKHIRLAMLEHLA